MRGKQGSTKAAGKPPAGRNAAAAVTVLDHPMMQHKLTLLRKQSTTTNEFRQVMHEIGPILLYEATRDLPLTHRKIKTPLKSIRAPVLAGKKLCLAPVLRAGLGMVDAMLSFAPSARVGHIGLYRDPKTLEAIEYYFNMPRSLPARTVIVVDPMLATGHSAVAALGRLKRAGARTLKLVCLLAAPAGIDLVQGEHPDVPIYAVSIDERLDDHAYIVPGLGDAGDRLFGTKKAAKAPKAGRPRAVQR
jgi:uracil phosphoribosyltransferase